MNLVKITSTHPELNTTFRYEGVDKTKNWIKTRLAEDFLYSKFFTLISDENECSLKKRVQNYSSFDTDVQQAADLLGFPAVLQKLHPRDYCRTIFQYIRIKLAWRIERLSTFLSEGTILDKQWEDIRYTLAFLRYRYLPGEIEKVEAFALDLDQQLKKYNIEPSDILKEIFTILKINSEFIDMSLLVFFKSKEYGSICETTVSVREMEQAFFETLEVVQKDCEWVSDKVEKIAQPFLNLPQHQYINPARAAMAKMNEFRRDIFPKFTQLVSQNLISVMGRTLEIFKFLLKFGSINEGPLGNPTGLGCFCVTCQVVIANVLEENKENKSNDESFDLDDYYRKNVSSLSQKYDLPKYVSSLNYMCDFPPSLTVSLGVWKYGELQCLSQFIKNYTHWHRLVDTYIANNTQSLMQFFAPMFEWYLKYSSSPRVLQLLKAEVEDPEPKGHRDSSTDTNIQLPPPVPPPAQNNKQNLQNLSIDEQVAFINSGSRTKKTNPTQNKRGGKRARKGAAYSTSQRVKSVARTSSFLTTSTTKVVSSTSSTTAQTTTAVSTSSSSFPIEESKSPSGSDFSTENCFFSSSLLVQMNALAAELRDQISVQKFLPQQRMTYRHAEIFLQDLAVLVSIKSTGVPKRERLYLFVSMANTLYHFLEQVLKAATQRAFDLPQHNLSLLAEGLTLTDDERKVIDSHSLTSYWTRYHYDQRAKWDRLKASAPDTLSALQQAFDHHQFQPLEQKLEYAIPIAIGLAMRLCVQESASASSSSRMPLVLLESHFHDLNMIMITLIDETKQILQKHTFPPQHFVSTKLKQAFLSLNQFQATIFIFQNNKIDSKAFSLHFRNSVLWFNYVIESLLRACYSFHTGFDTSEHDLTKLATLVNKHFEQPRLSLSMLEPFHELNRLARYPFSSNATLHSDLHILLLKAELLREHPEHHQGFISENFTDLNYIETPTGNASADDLLRKWSSIVQKTIPWLQKSLLPLFMLNRV